MPGSLSDRDVERLFAESRLGWCGRRVTHAVRASWLASRSRSWMAGVASDWRPLNVGAAGWTATVAAVTTLIVQRLAGGHVEPTTSVLPIVVAVGGLALPWLAGRRSGSDGRHGS